MASPPFELLDGIGSVGRRYWMEKVRAAHPNDAAEKTRFLDRLRARLEETTTATRADLFYGYTDELPGDDILERLAQLLRTCRPPLSPPSSSSLEANIQFALAPPMSSKKLQRRPILSSSESMLYEISPRYIFRGYDSERKDDKKGSILFDGLPALLDAIGEWVLPHEEGGPSVIMGIHFARGDSNVLGIHECESPPPVAVDSGELGRLIDLFQLWGGRGGDAVFAGSIKPVKEGRPC